MVKFKDHDKIERFLKLNFFEYSAKMLIILVTVHNNILIMCNGCKLINVPDVLLNIATITLISL